MRWIIFQWIILKEIRLFTSHKKVAAGIKRRQDAESGVWYQVLDKGNEDGNYLEASCSSMFCVFPGQGTEKTATSIPPTRK